jgi:hypothetical protein
VDRTAPAGRLVYAIWPRRFIAKSHIRLQHDFADIYVNRHKELDGVSLQRICGRASIVSEALTRDGTGSRHCELRVLKRRAGMLSAGWHRCDAHQRVDEAHREPRGSASDKWRRVARAFCTDMAGAERKRRLQRYGWNDELAKLRSVQRPHDDGRAAGA